MTTDLSRSNTPTNPFGATILVVEDVDDHWYMIRWALTQTMPSVSIMRTVNGSDTMAYLAACSYGHYSLPKLILMDLYLPGREDGWALLEEVKLHHIYRRLPVIILSASNSPDDVEQSYYLRSTSYIRKPITLPEWLACFDNIHRYWQEAVSLY